MSHLDELFEKIVQDKLRLLEQEWLEFKTSHEHWTEEKIYREMLLGLRKVCNEMTESKWKNGGNSYLSASLSEYKTALFSWFQRLKNGYKVKPVHYFMQEDYPKLQENFFIKFSIASDYSEITNLQLSEFFAGKEEVVEQLAHNEAILKFIKKLESNSIAEKKATSFSDEVRGLFATSRHDEALELLNKYLKNVSSPLVDQIILLQSRYSRIQIKYRQAVISNAEESEEIAKITNSALAILRDFEKENP